MSWKKLRYEQKNGLRITIVVFKWKGIKSSLTDRACLRITIVVFKYKSFSSFSNKNLCLRITIVVFKYGMLVILVKFGKFKNNNSCI